MSVPISWDKYIAKNYPYLSQDEDGRWITLENGRHIFIEEGETLEKALERHKIPIKLPKHKLSSEIHERVDKVLKNKGFEGIQKHTIPKTSHAAMQIRFTVESGQITKSFGVNYDNFSMLNEDVGTEDTKTAYNFALYHEIGHLQQAKDDPNMPLRYNESRKQAEYYENDADKRAEEMTGIKKTEVDNILERATKVRREKIFGRKTEESPYVNFLRDCIVLEGITKKEEGEETSSPVPAEWADEIQKALDGWRDAVFIQDVEGLLRDPKTQKISKQE